MRYKVTLLLITSLALSACKSNQDYAPKSINEYSLQGSITTVVALSTLTSRFTTHFSKNQFVTTPIQSNALTPIKKNSGYYHYKKINNKNAKLTFIETKGPNPGLTLDMTLQFKEKNKGTFTGTFLHNAAHPQSGHFSLKYQPS